MYFWHMKAITTRIEIEHKLGARLFNTTDWEDLQYLQMPQDPEGFSLRHFKVGTEFSIIENELASAGNYRVVKINTYIMDEHNAGHENSINGGYEWGLHVVYVVEDSVK